MKTKVKLAIVSRTVFYLPVWIASHKKFFDDEGLDVSVEVFGNAEKINTALRDGTVQIAVSTPESIMSMPYVAAVFVSSPGTRAACPILSSPGPTSARLAISAAR